MWGELDGLSIVTAVTEIYSNARWQNDFDVVWDLTKATALHFEWKDYEEWLELDKDLGDHVGNGRCMILVGSDLHEAILKSYAQLARNSSRKVVVFRRREDLEKALREKQGN